MAQISPNQLILRCYGYNNGKYWLGHCIDLDIAVQAANTTEMKNKMEEAIASFLEVVIDTDDKNSIPALLQRKAPLSAILKFHLISALMTVHSLRRKLLTFNEALPFQIGPICPC